MAHAANTVVLASTKVFSIVELLEQILFDLAGLLSNFDTNDNRVHTPSKQLFVLQSVNTTFRDTIKSNTHLQEHMWLKVRKNTTPEFDHIPMRWLLKHLKITKQELRPRNEYEAHRGKPKSEKFIGVELHTLKLDYIEKAHEIGHGLRLNRLWAPPSEDEIANTRAWGKQTWSLPVLTPFRPSWWKMKVFGSEEALPLRIRFEVRYAGEDRPLKRYWVDWQAKWQEGLTLGDFVIQYLEAIRVGPDGNLLACREVDEKQDVGVQQIPAAYRGLMRDKRLYDMKVDQSKVEAAMRGDGLSCGEDSLEDEKVRWMYRPGIELTTRGQ